MNKCRDCIHCDVCELNPFITAFSPDNDAYCGAFKSREEYAPVKIGLWMWHECGWWMCSECGCSPADWEADPDNEYGLPPYCHSCGAKLIPLDPTPPEGTKTITIEKMPEQIRSYMERENDG